MNARKPALRFARVCYDHLAGRLGVSLSDALTSAGYAELSDESGVITERGLAFLEHLGIDVSAMRERTSMRSGRLLCRPCLDWSERRLHIGGTVGKALADRCFALRWIERKSDSRAVMVTRTGERGFREAFGI